MSWTIETIGRCPQVLDRLRKELDACPDADISLDDANHPYLEMVFKETLRRHPIVSEVLRETAKPVSIGGFDLPAGVGISIAAIHNRPDLYPKPSEFRPERFAERKFGPHEYLPFGGGSRRCLGATFASFETRVALATAMREFDYTLLQTQAPQPVRRNLTMEPKGGVPVSISYR